MVVKCRAGNRRSNQQSEGGLGIKRNPATVVPPDLSPTAATTYATFQVLSEQEASLTVTDLKVVAHIIHTAEAAAQHYPAPPGQHASEFSLHSVLQAYEQVLPKYSVDPAEDVHFYRLLLKLSLDPTPCWWAKFQNECMSHGLQHWQDAAAGGVHAGPLTPASVAPGSIPDDGLPFYTTYNVSPSPARTPNSIKPAKPAQSPARKLFPPHQVHGAPGGSALVLSDISNLRDAGAARSVDAEAFYDFKLVTWSFATWRHHAGILVSSRVAKEEALQNWRMAVAFWEISLARRCFRHLARHAAATTAAVSAHVHATTLRRLLRAWAAHTRAAEAALEAAHAWRGDCQLLRSFRAWRRVTSDRRLEARNGLRALTHWMGTSTSAVLAAWRGYVRLVAATLGDALAARRLALRRAVLAEWRAVAKRLVREAWCEQQLAARNCRRVLRDNVETWRARCKSSSKHRQLLAVAVAKMISRAASAAFAQWREYSAYRRKRKQQWAAVLLTSATSLRAKSFATWKAYHRRCVQQQEKQHLALSFFCSRSASVVFQAWHLRVGRARELAELAEGAREVHMQLLGATAFYCWLDYLHVAHELREAVLLFMRGMSTGLVAACFQGWRAQAERTTHLLELMEVVAARAGRGLLQRALQGWVEHWLAWQQEQELEDALARHSEEQIMGRALQLWQAELRRRLKAKRAVIAILTGSLQRSFLHWREAAQRQQQWRLMVADCLGSMQQYRKQKPFQAWSKWAHRKSMIKRLAANWFGEQQESLCRRVLHRWRLRCVTASAKRAMQRRCTRIWSQGAVRKVLATWKARAAHWAVRRQHTATARQHADLRLLRKALSTWCSLQKHAAAALQRAVGCWQAKSLQQGAVYVQNWHLAAVQLRRKKAVLQRVLQHSRSRTLAVSFYSWRIHSERKALQSAKLLTALKHMLQRSMAKAFTRWRHRAAAAALTRQKAVMVIALVAGRQLVVSWECWRAFVRRQKRDNAAVAHWCQRRIGAALRALGRAAQLGKLFHAAVASVGAQQAAELLRDTWLLWRCYVVQSHTAKAMLFRCVFHWVTGNLARSLNAWRAHVDLKRHRRHVMASAMRHWQLSAAAVALQSWRLVCRIHGERLAIVTSLLAWRADRVVLWWHIVAAFGHHLRACGRVLAASRRKRVLAACLQKWRQWVPLSCTKRLALQRAMGFWTGAGAAKAWTAWREVVASWKAKKAGLAAAVRLWQRAFLGAAWRSWRDWTRLMQRLHQAAQLFTGRSKAAAFWSWREAIRQKRGRAAQLEAAASRWRHRHAALAWASWQAFIVERRGIHGSAAVILRRWQQRDLHAAFRQLRGNVHCSRRKRIVLARWAGRVFLQGLQAFRGNVARQQALRRAVCRWQQAMLRCGFGAFAGNAARRQRKRDADEHSRRRRLKGCLRGWAAQACRLRGKCVAVARAVERWQGVVCREALGVWRWQAQRWAGKRALLQRAMGLLRSLQLRKAFGAWAEEAARRLCLREAAGKVLRSWMHSTALRAFNSWWEYAAGRAGLRAAGAAVLQRWSNLALSSAFQSWLVCTELAATKRAMRDTAALHHEQQLLGSCFLGWHSAAWHDTRERWVEGFRLQHSIQPLFAFWQGWAARQHQLRGAATRIALHWAQCGLASAFTTWQEAVHLRSHQRVILRRASCLWSGRLLAAAFVTWQQHAGKITALKLGAQQVMLVVAHGRACRAWHSWALHLLSCRKKHLATQLYLRRLLHKVLEAWHLTADERCELHRRAGSLQGRVLARMMHLGLLSSLATWRHVARTRRRLKLLVLRVTVRQLGAVLGAWRAAARQLRGSKLLLRRHLGRTCCDVMLLWGEVAGERRRLRGAQAALSELLEHDCSGLTELFRYSVERWRHSLLSAALDTWLANVVSLADLREKSAAAFDCLYRSLARKALYALGLRVQRCRRLAAMEQYARDRTRRLVLLRWRQWVAVRIRQQVKVTAALGCSRKVQLQRCLATWHALAVRVARLRASVNYCMSKAMRRRQWKLLSSWKAVAWLYGTAARQLEAVLWRQVLASFRAWREHVRLKQATRLEQQAIIAHLYGKRNHALALGCLQSWHGWACKQAKLTAAVVWWALNLMRTAFYGWLILERQIGAWGRRAILRRSWLRWSAAVGAARVEWHHAAVARQHCAVTLLWKAMASWHAWTVYALQRAAAEEELAEVSGAFLARRTVAAWYRAWQAVAFHRQSTWRKCVRWWAWHTQRCAELRACQQHLQSMRAAVTLANCFYDWCWEVQDRKAREDAYEARQAAIREAVRVGDQIFQERRRALLAACLQAWWQRAALLRAVGEGVRLMMQRLLEEAFRAWSSAARRAALLREQSESFAAFSRRMRALRRWREAARAGAQHTALMLRQAGALSRRLLQSRALAAWLQHMQLRIQQQQALAAALAVVEAASVQELQQAAWRAWRQHCQRKRGAVQLLQAAEKHFARRMLKEVLEAWQQFATAMHNLRPEGSRSGLQSAGSLMWRMASLTRTSQDAEEYAAGPSRTARQQQQQQPPTSAAAGGRPPLSLRRRTLSEDSYAPPARSIASVPFLGRSRQGSGHTEAGQQRSSNGFEVPSPIPSRTPFAGQRSLPTQGRVTASSIGPSIIATLGGAHAASRPSWSTRSLDAPLQGASRGRAAGGTRLSAAGSIRSILEDAASRRRSGAEGGGGEQEPARGSAAMSTRVLQERLVQGRAAAAEAAERGGAGGGVLRLRASLDGRQQQQEQRRQQQQQQQAAVFEDDDVPSDEVHMHAAFRGFRMSGNPPASGQKVIRSRPLDRRSGSLQIPAYDLPEMDPQAFDPTEWHRSPTLAPASAASARRTASTTHHA